MLALAAVATGLAVLIWRWRHEAPVRRPSIEVRLGGSPSASDDRTIVMRGDRVQVRAVATQVWVFRGDEILIACPGPACSPIPDGFALAWTTERAGRHRVLAAIGPTLAAAGGFDELVLTARAAGAELHLAAIDVIEP